MLTLARPPTPAQAAFFSRSPSTDHPRLVELNRWTAATRKREARERREEGEDPDILVRGASRSQGGVVETLYRVGRVVGVPGVRGVWRGVLLRGVRPPRVHPPAEDWGGRQGAWPAAIILNVFNIFNLNGHVD